MILGIGSDLVDIRRIEAMLARYGERFEEKVFTQAERQKAAARGANMKAATLAKRFAGKEACVKALGVRLKGIGWREMGVVNLESGQPTLVLSGRAAECLALLTPQNLHARIDLSMSDEHPFAQAFVVISAVPQP